MWKPGGEGPAQGAQVIAQLWSCASQTVASLPPLDAVTCEPLPWEPPAVDPEPVPPLAESSESPPV
jgi:hypothetical protein